MSIEIKVDGHSIFEIDTPKNTVILKSENVLLRHQLTQALKFIGKPETRVCFDCKHSRTNTFSDTCLSCAEFYGTKWEPK